MVCLDKAGHVFGWGGSAVSHVLQGVCACAVPTRQSALFKPHPHPQPACLPQIAGTALGSAEAVAALDADVLRRLKADVAMELNALRNAAYAGGFAAAKGAITAVVDGQFA